MADASLPVRPVPAVTPARRVRVTVEHLARCAEVTRIAAPPEGQTCAWCNYPFTANDAVYPLGGRLVHDNGDEDCLAQIDRAIYGERRGGGAR